VDSFQSLHGIEQLPGLAVQRLMAEGYGFGAEGDWKTAALLRAMKVMTTGLSGGNSFMEDYTYHFEPNRERVLGAHMLEICPSIAEGTPNVEIHPLEIGGKSDPVRMVFDAATGSGVNATIIDMGGRMRLLSNEVDIVAPDAPLSNLPVARAVWVPRPDLYTSATAWLYSGGAHHTVLSQAATTEMLEDYADIAQIELAVIDDNTELRPFREKLETKDLYWRLHQNV
jgi:L-arabinose isomerase